MGHDIGIWIANEATSASISNVLRITATAIILTVVHERWYGIDQESAEMTATRGAGARERLTFCTAA